MSGIVYFSCMRTGHSLLPDYHLPLYGVYAFQFSFNDSPICNNAP